MERNRYGHVSPVGSCDKGGGWAAMGHCPDLSNGTGFRGAEWPDVGFPMADGRLSFTDGQTRFTGGLMATNLIFYFEYSRDMALLNSTIYPFVRDNAEFYASYSRICSSSGTVVLPYTCGQEQCVCRDFGRGNLWPNETLQCKQPDAPNTVRCDVSERNANRSKCRGCLPDITVRPLSGVPISPFGFASIVSRYSYDCYCLFYLHSFVLRAQSTINCMMNYLGSYLDLVQDAYSWLEQVEAAGGPGSHTHGEHNAHADIAFASASFRKAIQYSTLLGVDADLRRSWQSLLDHMPAYPSVKLRFLPGTGGERAGLNAAPGLFTEAEYGHTPAMTASWYNLPNKTSETTPIVWPFCNANYPIANFAAMWPTDEIGVVQTANDTQLLAIAKATVYALNDVTGWDNNNGCHFFGLWFHK